MINADKILFIETSTNAVHHGGIVNGETTTLIAFAESLSIIVIEEEDEIIDMIMGVHRPDAEPVAEADDQRS